MDANDAGRIIAVVDRRIERLTGSEAAVETTWGEVCGISADGKYVSAYLHGDTDIASQDFRIPGTLAVSLGDKVKVAWNGRGERWVYDVALASEYKKIALNPNTGEILAGDGTALPEALTLDVDGAIGDHEAAADPHPGYADTSHEHTSFSGDLDIAGDLDVAGTALMDAIGISMYKSSSQSISTGGSGGKVTSYTNTWRSALGVTWDAYGGSEVRIDIAGVYLVVVQGSFDGNATGSRAFGIMTDNGTSPTAVAGSYDYGNLAQVSNTGAPRLSSSLVRSFAVNDTIAAVAYQSSGGSLNAYGVVLSVFYLGR